MAKILQAAKGVNDILPEAMEHWRYLEDILRRLAANYGYQEIRTPILEETELFRRTIGEVTDIVEKEMYTFSDRDKRSLTMRPEGTAGVVRAGIEHGLFYNQVQRLWYCGPVFRHERPQRGRYRQFHQFGMEAIGMTGAEIDAELILFNARLWQETGLLDQVELQINSLGTSACRAAYRDVLVKYFESHQHALDEDSHRRLYTNPLRILDSKNPDMQSVIAAAPKLQDFLDQASTAHFEKLQYLLRQNGIPYVVNPRLVRGLDYYTDTVFEWVTKALGAQGTVSAGGRYDGLIAQLGGQTTPAVGFALGMERVIELLKLRQDLPLDRNIVDIYFIMLGEKAMSEGLRLSEAVRRALPRQKIMTHLADGGIKNQFKRADKSGAKIALILGDEEVSQGLIGVKFLREEKAQETLRQAELVNYLQNIIK